MTEWLRRVAGVSGVALTWAVGWAAVGALIETLDRSGTVARLWLGPAIGVLPGFVAGVVFSVALSIAANGRRLAELSLPTPMGCGGLAGLLVGMLPFAINEPPGEVALWRVAAVVIGSMALMGAASAAASLAVARRMTAAGGHATGGRNSTTSR